jgi:hypothetical protein
MSLFHCLAFVASLRLLVSIFSLRNSELCHDYLLPIFNNLSGSYLLWCDTYQASVDRYAMQWHLKLTCTLHSVQLFFAVQLGAGQTSSLVCHLHGHVLILCLSSIDAIIRLALISAEEGSVYMRPNLCNDNKITILYFHYSSKIKYHISVKAGFCSLHWTCTSIKLLFSIKGIY